MKKKLVVEKIKEEFIKLWQEFHEWFKEKGCEKLINSLRELAKLEREKRQIFWQDLRKKYSLENAEHLQINHETWQIFEIFENENREVQVVPKISEDLINQWQEIEKIRKEIAEIGPEATAILLLSSVAKKAFWDTIEGHYHLKGKSLSLDTETWSIYEDAEDARPPSLEEDLIRHIKFKNIFNALNNLSDPFGISQNKDKAIN